MNPSELALQCVASIENGTGFVTLVLPRRAGGGMRMRLCGRSSPLGELLCENSQSEAVCRFDAVDVLAWLAANNLVLVIWNGPSK